MTKDLAKDIAERAVWTFVQAFTAAWVVVDGQLAPSAKTAALAGLAAVVALIKGVAASRLGEQNAALPG